MIVRPIEPDDADGFIAVFEAVAAEGRWIGSELPIGDDREARLRASAEQPSDQACTLVAADGDRIVGFARVDLDHGRCHLGMALLPECRGRGLGSGTTQWVRRMVRAPPAPTKSISRSGRTTLRRRNLYERAGFVLEGRRRRHWRRNSGELWDSIEMSLVLDETSPGSPYDESADEG